MKNKTLLLTLLAMIIGLAAKAETGWKVTAGSQVTTEAALVSGKPYLVYYVGSGNPGYMKDTGTSYNAQSDPTPDLTAVYTFTDNGDGTWSVQNHETLNYWGTPTANATTYFGSATAGAWALNFQANGNIAPSCNGHSLNRSSGKIHPWSTGTAASNQFKIENVTIEEVEVDMNIVTNRTPLSAAPSGDGWYVISVKSGTYAGHAVYVPESEIEYQTNRNYPLSFSKVDGQPTIDNTVYYTHIAKTANGYAWQLPNGRYLRAYNKFFPVSTEETVDNVSITYSAGNGMQFIHSGYKAIPYYLGSKYFIGETSGTGGFFDVYPIDLAEAGLTAWRVIIPSAGADTRLACTRDDVKGLTSVYNGGYFFLPAGVTPTTADFALVGMLNCIVDAEAQTVTVEYDPTLAILPDGVSVAQGYQTAGRDSEVMLLSMVAKPFRNATGASFGISLKDGAEALISKLTLYEASNESPEIMSTGSGAPTKTVLAEVTNPQAATDMAIGNLTAGNHYYWLAATVKGDAPVGNILDAAVTSLTYTCYGAQTTLDLTDAGDPADRGAMVFETRSYPFLPRDNGSRVYRIPALVTADDGSLVAAVDKRYDSFKDIGGGHVIDIVVRRSTDGGKTWGDPVVVAKGLGTADDAKCGYGDPSLTKGKDGRLYLLFAAGNTGYFYGLNRICMSTSDDNGATWTTPVDLYETGRITDHASSFGSTPCYGLYDYFVTSGKGLYTHDGVLMYLLPAQPYTNAEKTEKTNNSHDFVFYSTDDGDTWHISETPAIVGGDEAKLEQANDGSLIASVRQSDQRGFNTGTYVKNDDGTVTFTWGEQYNTSQLTAGGYPNNQDILYYSRATDLTGADTGEPDILLHTMTTGQHANLNLFMSLNGGEDWKQVCQIQPKGVRYVTLTKLQNGNLGMLFEDQGLNEAGGYTDYNHYPINFLTITREQLLAWYDEAKPWFEEQEQEGKFVKIVQGLTGHTTYGTLSGDTWTSKKHTGNKIAGLTLTKSDGKFDQFSTWNGHFNLAYHPAMANVPATLTLQAPEGYLIKGYSLLAAKAYSAAHTYTLEAEDGTTITPKFASSAADFTELSQTDIYAKTATISVTTTDASKFLAIADFVVELTQEYPLALHAIGDATYATLYLPFGITLPSNVTAYKVAVNGEWAIPTSIGQELPKETPALLYSAEGATTAQATINDKATADASGNQLQGVLTKQHVDGYVLNQKDQEAGFFRLSSTGELDAYRAYLPANVGEVKGFILNWSTDGIEKMRDGENEEMRNRENEKMRSAIFDLSGRRVSKPQKGIYIMNGNKVIVE